MTSKSEARRLWHQLSDSSDVASTVNRIASKVRGMTPEEFKESLIRAGILTKDGKLTEAYK